MSKTCTAQSSFPSGTQLSCTLPADGHDRHQSPNGYIWWRVLHFACAGGGWQTHGFRHRNGVPR